MLHSGIIFADHESMYVSTKHQVNPSYEVSLKSKPKCGVYATNYRVLVQSCHTKNGIFTCKKLMEVIIGQVENIRFGGVGYTHQNGVSDNSIKTVTSRYHTMMIYASMRSP